MMKTIPLTKGKVALVDDIAFDFLSQWKWRAAMSPHRKAVYAVRSERRDGKRVHIRMHRLLLNAERVDHHNGDGLDNQRGNLRAANSTKNNVNVAPRACNKSGFKGVVRDKHRWRADISMGNKDVYLGGFATPQEAACAYDAAATVLHGEFAWTNASHGLL